MAHGTWCNGLEAFIKGEVEWPVYMNILPRKSVIIDPNTSPNNLELNENDRVYFMPNFTNSILIETWVISSIMEALSEKRRVKIYAADFEEIEYLCDQVGYPLKNISQVPN